MDQETGWKELMRQAKSGDAEAQCRLGRTEKNPERAEYWLEKAVAANPDDDDALYNLGSSHSRQAIAGRLPHTSPAFSKSIPKTRTPTTGSAASGCSDSTAPPTPPQPDFTSKPPGKSSAAPGRLLRSKRFQSRMGEKTE